MSTEKARIVLDTNVIVSAIISKEGMPATILELLFKGKVINFTTDEIIAELIEVLGRDFIKETASGDYRDFILSELLSHSIALEPIYHEFVIREDKSDDKFINCALTANADIVSGDRHLLSLGKYKDIVVLSPREFLGMLK